MADCIINPIEILKDLSRKYTIAEKWSGSTFEDIKKVPNTNKGDLGEEFVLTYSKNLGFPTNKEGNRLGDIDLSIAGQTFEVKLATEDINGSFQFNHVRYDYKYDYLVCIGISPNDILFGMWNKADVVTGKAGNLVSMGRGQNSSFKLTKKQSSLRPISEFEEVLKKLDGQDVAD